MTQKRISCCLVLATYEEKVDRIKLVEIVNQFVSKMDIGFPFMYRYFPRKFIISAVKETQTSNKVVVQ